MLASVIVPCRDAAGTLERSLTAILAQELDGPFEVIVADDRSADRSVEIAAAHHVRVVSAQAAGPGAARNAAASVATGSILAFTDADCFPRSGWLAAGVSALTDLDLVQGAVGADPEAPLGPFDRTVWATEETGLYETANLFVRRSVFEQIGGFEPWLMPADGKELAEDVWLGWRARRAGARTGFRAAARVDHAVFARTAREYVAERRRLVHFPAIVSRVPELRRELLFGGLFLARRTAAFDFALLAIGGAVASASPAPLVAALPYGWMLFGERRWRRRAPSVIAARVAADGVGLAALMRGSLAARSPVL